MASSVGAWDSHLPFGQAARIWFLSSLGEIRTGEYLVDHRDGSDGAGGAAISALAATGSSVIMQAVSLRYRRCNRDDHRRAAPRSTGARRRRCSHSHRDSAQRAALSSATHGRGLGRSSAETSRHHLCRAASIWTAAVASALSWLFYGFAFQLFVHGLLGAAPGEISRYIAVYTAAYILGFISPIAPAGLGVREFTLAAFMTQLGLANEADAALVAIAARLWLTIIELVPSGFYVATGATRKSLPNP